MISQVMDDQPAQFLAGPMPADQCRVPRLVAVVRAGRRRGGRQGGAAPCAEVVAATVRRPAPGGHNVGMIVMTTMRADLG
jgi:hypothetical protein